MECALELEAAFKGDRPRVVWLLISDSDGGPDLLTRDIKAAIRAKEAEGRWSRGGANEEEPRSAPSPPRALVTGSRGPARGLHTGAVYQVFLALRSLSRRSHTGANRRAAVPPSPTGVGRRAISGRIVVLAGHLCGHGGPRAPRKLRPHRCRRGARGHRPISLRQVTLQHIGANLKSACYQRVTVAHF